MKKRNYLSIIFIALICFLVFPQSSKADPIKSGTDSCVNNQTCLQMCEWDNGGYHAYVYYVFADQSWKYVWYYQYNPFRAERSASTLPTKNVFYENDTIKNELSTAGKCPAGAYVDQDGFGIAAEFCLDSGKIYETTKKGVTKSHCVKNASNFGTTFQGTSSLIYNVNDHIRIYFENHAIPSIADTKCESLADSTGYAVDASKVQPLIDQVSTDFTQNFLYNNPIPTWMKQGSYNTWYNTYKNRLQLKVKACNVELGEKAKNDLANGNTTQDVVDQSKENASNAEQDVQNRTDQLDQNITSGTSPSSPTYTPNLPNVGASNASCTGLLGTKTMDFLKEILTYIQIAGVVLGVVLGMTEFAGAIMNGEADANKKASKRLIIRIAMVAALLLTPALLKFVLNTFGLDGNSICIL